MTTSFCYFAFQNFEEGMTRTYGKSVKADVVEKKQLGVTRGGGVGYQLTLKVGEKTYYPNVEEELYTRVGKGTQLEVLQYKDRVVLYDSYDLK
ncbi:hypothetical protein COM61_02045 [Bacillus toyonensis]|nr:hypothetical protein COM61_02045 [Bacillus toyonensis]